MAINTEHIKLIFGLKIKEIRKEKGLSLAELSEKTGISQSYINEIEKGKKYPKTDKINKLAEALGVEYDELVSLKVNKKLEPLVQLLQTNFLTEIPFDFFGVDPASLLELMSEAPDKLSAFINSIIEIGRNYNMSVERFYFASLRAYQEMHNNFFPELEEAAILFLKENKLNFEHVNQQILKDILAINYDVSVGYFDEEDQPLLANLRSVYQPKTRTLLINKRISEDQQVFTIAKEIGYFYLNLKERPITSSWIEVKSFEEVLSNFKASYFAGALQVPKEQLISETKNWFSQKTWDAEYFETFVGKFKTTPETLMHRMSNILPQYFGLNNIIFVRFEAQSGTKDYKLTKEMHLSKKLGSRETQSEHYCRRWASISLLDHISFKQSIGKYTKPLVDAQISTFVESKNRFFAVTMARRLNIERNRNESVTLGIGLDDPAIAQIKFLNDNSIVKQDVNQTCERCSIFDCKERLFAPTVLQKQRHRKEMKKLLEKF